MALVARIGAGTRKRVRRRGGVVAAAAMPRTPLTHDTATALHPGAKALLERVEKQGIIIGTERGGAAESTPLIDPSDGTVLGAAPIAAPEDVDLAVFAARCALPAWKATAPAERARLLMKLADVLEAHAVELADLEALDVGKPVTVAKHHDVPHSIGALRYMAALAMVSPSGSGDVIVPTRTTRSHAYTVREPVGVVGCITPWNFPLVIGLGKAAAALAAGCTVVLKPPEQAPLSSIRLVELASEVLPAGVLSVVPGVGATGAYLAAHPGVNAISFTGSTVVGRDIVASAARTNLKRVNLELGGKSPHIIFADCDDLDAAISSAAKGLFANSGQVCCAGTRLLVERPVLERVLKGLEEESNKLVLGAALNPASTLGPLVSDAQLSRATELVEEGERAGLQVAFGGAGTVTNSDGYYMSPTMMVSAEADPLPSDNPAWSNEIFGPVGIAVPFEPGTNLDEIASLANDTEYGLAAGVWTGDVRVAHTLPRLIDAGNVWVNGYFPGDVALPFGGFKLSGWGREQGRASLETFQEVKTVTIGL